MNGKNKRDGRYCNHDCPYLKPEIDKLNPYCKKLKKDIFFDYHGFIAECDENEYPLDKASDSFDNFIKAKHLRSLSNENSTK